MVPSVYKEGWLETMFIFKNAFCRFAYFMYIEDFWLDSNKKMNEKGI